MQGDFVNLLAPAGLSVALLALAGCAWLALRLRRLSALLEDRVEPMSRDLRMLCAAGSRAGDRLQRVESEARRLRERQAQSELRAPGAEGYRHAIALVQRGAGAEELVTTCGMARGEAELLCLLHGAGGTVVEHGKAH